MDSANSGIADCQLSNIHVGGNVITSPCDRLITSTSDVLRIDIFLNAGIKLTRGVIERDAGGL